MLILERSSSFISKELTRHIQPAQRYPLRYLTGFKTLATMSSAPEAKRQRTELEYELLYHPGIPGRGEYVRLMFEAKGVKFQDTANENPPNDSGPNGYAAVKEVMSPDSIGDEDGNPPVFAPPALRHHGVGKNGKALVIQQTPNIMLYLGNRIGLAGGDEAEKYWVNQIALTALDLSNEAHDSHRPSISLQVKVFS